ncbi:uncharacterized protein LOC134714335 [Mytilus trossulus]|uniref:uncharacterized protein LOC134714335 n=1 Tax=Mytilus trossulus TaxID=6551 RepID=UPI0030062005
MSMRHQPNNAIHNLEVNVLSSTTPAVKSITESNLNGRFWLKLDGTDVKETLQHSVKDIWNGDVDLNDGQLEVLRTEYQSRLAWINSVHSTTEEDLKTCLETGLVNLELDVKFLQDAFKKATDDFRKKMNKKNANSEMLKGLNWEVVECNTLLQQCLAFMSTFKSDSVSRSAIKSTSQEYQIYLKNLFKKKRTAATHILVIAISDEQRNVKPYALQIQYLPYRSLRDQYVRYITAPIKDALTQAGIHVVGLVTGGEFNYLRTQGDTGPLHTWQLVHDSKEVVRKMSKATLESMLTYAGELDPEAFDKVLLDPRAGLSHAALTGQRPQSVEDAEKLLSYHVAASMQRNGFDCEAEYVSTVAAWHEASDGSLRGMGQLRHCKANYQMLNYIVADLMPWYQENYDFTYIDVKQ